MSIPSRVFCIFLYVSSSCFSQDSSSDSVEETPRFKYTFAPLINYKNAMSESKVVPNVVKDALRSP